MKMQDPRKREIFWIGGGSASWSGAADSDFRAVEDGYISVTPLTLDLTHLEDARRGEALVVGAVSGEQPGGRRRLVEALQERGVRDLAVLRAFDLTPRHLFVPTGMRHRAYEDSALPIGNGQTISQPSTHAKYLELLALTGKERVLEIGTGSGYQTVLLSHLASQVFSIERVGTLVTQARDAIRAAERVPTCRSFRATERSGGGSTRPTTRSW